MKTVGPSIGNLLALLAVGTGVISCSVRESLQVAMARAAVAEL